MGSDMRQAGRKGRMLVDPARLASPASPGPGPAWEPFLLRLSESQDGRVLALRTIGVRRTASTWFLELA